MQALIRTVQFVSAKELFKTDKNLAVVLTALEEHNGDFVFGDLTHSLLHSSHVVDALMQAGGHEELLQIAQDVPEEIMIDFS